MKRCSIDQLHPYTRLLKESVPEPAPKERESWARRIALSTTEGKEYGRVGCKFAGRCPHAVEICRRADPPDVEVDGRTVKCYLYEASAKLSRARKPSRKGLGAHEQNTGQGDHAYERDHAGHETGANPGTDPNIYGQFAEHLGPLHLRRRLGGRELADSEHPRHPQRRRGGAARASHSHVRWPGGCFADEYHWGTASARARTAPDDQHHWGGVVEDNGFGTHEFMDFCEQIGTRPYVCGNVGSGSVREMMEWVEYMTSDADSPMANLRRPTDATSRGNSTTWRRQRELGMRRPNDARVLRRLFRRYNTCT